jgi:hypothetical protein
LEQALLTAGVLDPDALETAADDPQVRTEAGARLDRSLSGLLRVLTEDDDARTPLRSDARGED